MNVGWLIGTLLDVSRPDQEAIISNLSFRAKCELIAAIALNRAKDDPDKKEAIRAFEKRLATLRNNRKMVIHGRWSTHTTVPDSIPVLRTRPKVS